MLSSQGRLTGKTAMATLDDVCDYILTKADEAHLSLNLLKLQKLVYYCQAWRLANEGRPLFDGKFQAWVHGPVSRTLYDRFRNTKNLYSIVSIEDRRPAFNGSGLSEDERAQIDAVLDAYGKYSGAQLEDLSHGEDPWIRARKGLPPAEHSEEALDEQVMAEFYKKRLAG